jgi:D-alanine-D-alanine ligase
MDSGAAKKLFVEQYIDGREFNVSLLEGRDGPEILPVAEIKFSNFPDGKPRILNYASKWTSSTFEFGNTNRTFDFESGDRLLVDAMRATSLQCWQMLDLGAYVRVDYRVDGAGKPWVLEVNANPCISPDSGFVASVQQAGYSYTGMIKRIIDTALSKV